MKIVKTLLTGIMFMALLAGNASADYAEDFSGGNFDDWFYWGTPEVVQSIQPDGTTGNVLQVGLTAGVIYKCGADWPNYTFEADIRMDNGGDFGMWWRKKNPYNPISEMYDAQWFRNYLTFRYVYAPRNGAWGQFLSMYWNWNYGKWYHMKVVLNGPNQKFYIDDTLMFEKNHDAFSDKGSIGFRTLYSTMSIDNIKVTGEGIKGCVTPVDIDIKPGSGPNSVNIGSNGVIPVAVLTTDDFYAVDVSADTVRFGPANASPSHSAFEDADGDGDLDLILHFRTSETGIPSGDTDAVLTGETVDGQKIQGSDSVRVLESNGKKK